MNVQYIYLLQEREFLNSNQNIYKIGKTKQKNNDRIKQYPKGSILLFQIICNNCDDTEKILIKKFNHHFICRKDIGNEYFEGDCKMMIDIIYQNIIICNKNKYELDNKYNKEKVEERDVKTIKPTNHRNEQMISFTEDFEIADDNNIYVCKTFECNICNTFYCSNNSLSNHNRLIHGVKKQKIIKEYNCIHCKRKYSSRQSRWTHQKKCKKQQTIPKPVRIEIDKSKRKIKNMKYAEEQEESPIAP